jgi:hypothetical protein
MDIPSFFNRFLKVVSGTCSTGSIAQPKMHKRQRAPITQVPNYFANVRKDILVEASTLPWEEKSEETNEKDSEKIIEFQE